MYKISLVGLLFILILSGCGSPTDDDSIITARLEPGAFTGERALRWSPKAASVALVESAGTLEGNILLGTQDGGPFSVKLEKSEGAAFFDVLFIDQNRDGEYSESERLLTTPKEIRNKMWSSFTSSLNVTITDSESGLVVVNPYPLSLWYVEDPREESQDHALRFTRSGWMQGTVMLEGIEAHIRVSESELDGVFDMDDEWTLALPDSVGNLFQFDHHRPAKRHAWLGENAYRLVSVDLSGRTATLEPIDPGVTRAKEALDDDQTRVDRMAPHSGEMVAFSHDFAEAEERAAKEGKHLFIDFETVWCGPCKTMEEWVYSADAVVDASRDLVSVKVDGDDFPEIGDRFEVAAYPTMILMSPEGEVTGRLVGYQGVEAMATFLSQ